MTSTLRSRLVVIACLFILSGFAFAGETAAPQQQQQQPQSVTPEQAFALMNTEAEKGNAAAMLTLGTLYERGIGTPRNFVKALEWYEKAAGTGMAEAYYNVGVCYEVGMGNSGDEQKAFTNFEKSAELGLPQGYYKLATLYFTGFGVPKNESWGVELLNRAAASGHMTAANDLGVIYHEGLYGMAKDPDKAFASFMQAANLGNAEAMKNIAVFYRDGIGRPADPKEELKWYVLSRRAGYPAGAVDNAAKKIIDTIGPEQAKQVETAVDAWIADFQQRNQAVAPQG